MTAITVANTDWSIVSDIDTALTGATISGVAVFESVTVTTSDDQAKECQFKGDTPLVVLLYHHTTEDEAPDDMRGCVVHLELILATKTTSGVDESTRMQEILRLMNAAKNAVEASPPSDKAAWGSDDFFFPAMDWGEPIIDITTRQPWLTCRLPLQIGYVLNTGTSH